MVILENKNKLLTQKMNQIMKLANSQELTEKIYLDQLKHVLNEN